MLFDAHTHINERSLSDKERADFIKSVEDAGMDGAVDVGYDLESSALAAKHAEMYDWCYAAVGCHPHDADSFDEIQLKMIRGLALKKKGGGHRRNRTGLLQKPFGPGSAGVLVQKTDTACQ